MTREEKSAYMKKYRKQNKERIKQQKREWKEKNPEKIKEYNKKYCEKNRERLAQKAREWHEANLERHKENCKKYYKKHKAIIIKRATEWNYEHWEKHLEYVRKSKGKKSRRKKMTKEQIKQKAGAEADKVIIGSGMDRASVIHLRHLLVTMYMQGATEATKELKEENAELKEELKAIDKAGEHVRQQINNAFRNKKPYWELEKENAELKARLNAINLLTPELQKRSKLKTQQLTKATNLLTRFVMASVYFNGKETDLVEEAEQFLKGESTTSNECHDCAKFDEMPKGPRCKTCDNGSHFQKKEEA